MEIPRLPDRSERRRLARAFQKRNGGVVDPKAVMATKMAVPCKSCGHTAYDEIPRKVILIDRIDRSQPPAFIPAVGYKCAQCGEGLNLTERVKELREDGGGEKPAIVTEG